MKKNATVVFLITFLFCLNISENGRTVNKSDRFSEKPISPSAILNSKINPDNPLKLELEHIDKLFHEGSENNFTATGFEMLKTSFTLCEKLMVEHSENYEVLWRYARGAYKYAESSKCLELDGWKKICGDFGKKGMKVAGEAQKIEPNRVEAYFWQTACIGEYIYDAGIITAIKEGFYPVTKRSMKKAYELDKSYHDYNPVFGMAMIYYSPPWPLKNNKKALKFLKEHNEKASFIWEDYIRYTRSADFYLKLKSKDEEMKKEAEFCLKKVLNDHPQRKYYYQWHNG